MNEKIEPFKARLKIALEFREMRAVDLCNKTKISQSTMSQYLSGYAEPKKNRLTLMATALGVNPTWLMGLDVPMKNKSSPSSGQAFMTYLASLGYRIYKDDPEHKPIMSSENISHCGLDFDTLKSLKLHIDSYTRAIVDSELLTLKENEIKQERLEKERTLRHLQNENIYKGSQFEKDWDRTHPELRAAHNDDADSPEQQQLMHEDMEDMEKNW